MSEYISREDAIALARKTPTDWENEVSVPVRFLKSISAADVVEVKHGEWKHRKSWTRNVCSACSFESIYATNYCPNCGAKMDGAADDDK